MNKIAKDNSAFIQAVSSDKPALTKDDEFVSQEKRQEIFNCGRSMGKVEGLNLGRKALTVAMIAQLKEFKEAKMYRASGIVNWENFCEQVLGVNHEVIDEQISYFKKFGPEFLEAATSISMSRKVFRELKALPDAELQQLIKGRAVRIDGEEIPLDEDHAEEIQAAVESLIGKYKKQATDEESQATLAAKENLKLKATLERKDQEIERLKEGKTPGEGLVDPKVYRAMELASEAVTRVMALCDGAATIDDHEVRLRVYETALSSLERAMRELRQTVTREFEIPEHLIQRG